MKEKGIVLENETFINLGKDRKKLSENIQREISRIGIVEEIPPRYDSNQSKPAWNMPLKKDFVVKEKVSFFHYYLLFLLISLANILRKEIFVDSDL